MIRIIALTDAGLLLAKHLQQCINDGGLAASSHCEIAFKPKPFAEKVQQWFVRGEPLIFICATGIVVRTLAPVLKNKYQDAPVLVLDEAGQFVIPLLSGHEGGANELGRKVANLLAAQLFITSAHKYLQPVYTVGMGCERGCSTEQLTALLETCLLNVGITINDIHSINSITLKADEQGLIHLAANLARPFNTYSVSELSQVEPLLSQRSDYVYRITGVYGVAESAALYAAKCIAKNEQQFINHGELILPKQKSAVATCAIVRLYQA